MTACSLCMQTLYIIKLFSAEETRLMQSSHRPSRRGDDNGAACSGQLVQHLGEDKPTPHPSHDDLVRRKTCCPARGTTVRSRSRLSVDPLTKRALHRRTASSDALGHQVTCYRIQLRERAMSGLPGEFLSMPSSRAAPPHTDSHRREPSTHATGSERTGL